VNWSRSHSKTSAVVLALALLLIAVPIGSAAAQEAGEMAPAVEPSSPAVAAADAAARAWLRLVDERNVEEAWATGSNVLQVSISPQRLKAAIGDGRRGLDSLAARTLLDFRPVTNPSDGAPGEYVVLRYRLRGSPAWSAVETVVPRREDGVWRVTGYAIQRD